MNKAIADWVMQRFRSQAITIREDVHTLETGPIAGLESKRLELPRPVLCTFVTAIGISSHGRWIVRGTTRPDLLPVELGCSDFWERPYPKRDHIARNTLHMPWFSEMGDAGLVLEVRNVEACTEEAIVAVYAMTIEARRDR